MAYDNDWKKRFDPQTGRLEQNAPSACTVDPIVGFSIPTSYEEYQMLTDEQKFRLYELAQKPNDLSEGSNEG